MTKTNMVEVIRRLTRGMAAAALADHSDPQLVALALAAPGESAFHAIVQRHGPMVYRVCWRILQHTQDTEDDVGSGEDLGYKSFNPPSLRGVSQAGPFFHDGRAATLEEVFTRHRHQLKTKLAKENLVELLAFLESL